MQNSSKQKSLQLAKLWNRILHVKKSSPHFSAPIFCLAFSMRCDFSSASFKKKEEKSTRNFHVSIPERTAIVQKKYVYVFAVTLNCRALFNMVSIYGHISSVRNDVDSWRSRSKTRTNTCVQSGKELHFTP